jgi:hypothetical protein
MRAVDSLEKREAKVFALGGIPVPEIPDLPDGTKSFAENTATWNLELPAIEKRLDQFQALYKSIDIKLDALDKRIAQLSASLEDKTEAPQADDGEAFLLDVLNHVRS